MVQMLDITGRWGRHTKRRPIHSERERNLRCRCQGKAIYCSFVFTMRKVLFPDEICKEFLFFLQKQNYLCINF